MRNFGFPAPRKPLRLRNYDYSQAGTYFLAICTQDRVPLLWTVGQGLCPCLSSQGKIAEEELLAIPQRFSTAVIEKYVIMPNHVHVLLTLRGQGQSPCPTGVEAPTVGAVIGAYKSITTKRVNQSQNTLGKKLWQFRFYDHVVRDEGDYFRIWNYIDTNPDKWAEDRYYIHIP